MKQREIKFRSWDRVNNKWVIASIYDIGKYSDMIDKSTTGMYTGLKDRVGREICEGDIVKWEEEDRMDKKNGICKIIWSGTGLEIEDSDFGYEGEHLISWDNLIIIGNIHENQDLLDSEY